MRGQMLSSLWLILVILLFFKNWFFEWEKNCSQQTSSDISHISHIIITFLIADRERISVARNELRALLEVFYYIFEEFSDFWFENWLNERDGRL